MRTLWELVISKYCVMLTLFMLILLGVSFVKSRRFEQKQSGFHLIFGVAMLIVGAYGFYDEAYNVLDFITGAVNAAFVVLGIGMLFFAVSREKYRTFNYGVGGVLLIVGLYGLYDEWQSFADLFVGLLAVACIVIGALSLTIGVRYLRS